MGSRVLAELVADSLVPPGVAKGDSSLGHLVSVPLGEFLGYIEHFRYILRRIFGVHSGFPEQVLAVVEHLARINLGSAPAVVLVLDL